MVDFSVLMPIENPLAAIVLIDGSGSMCYDDPSTLCSQGSCGCTDGTCPGVRCIVSIELFLHTHTHTQHRMLLVSAH